VIIGTALASAGTVNTDSIVEFDVTAAVTGNGIYSFAMKSSSADAVHYQSKEGAVKPELVVRISAPVIAPDDIDVTDHAESEEEEEEESRTDTGYQPGGMPKELVLSFAYPNPFNAQTRIEFGLAEEGRVRLMIFNALGQVIRTLVDEVQAPGYKRVMWDGKDKHGLTVSSGMYLYTLEFGGQRLTGKVILQQ